MDQLTCLSHETFNGDPSEIYFITPSAEEPFAGTGRGVVAGISLLTSLFSGCAEDDKLVTGMELLPDSLFTRDQSLPCDFLVDCVGEKKVNKILQQ